MFLALDQSSLMASLPFGQNRTSGRILFLGHLPAKLTSHHWEDPRKKHFHRRNVTRYHFFHYFNLFGYYHKVCELGEVCEVGEVDEVRIGK